MHVASILAFGLVITMLLRDCEAVDEKVKMQDRDGNPAGKRQTHLNALAEDDEDRELWEKLGKKRESSEEAGFCHLEDRTAHRLYRQFVNSLRSLMKEMVEEKYGESSDWTHDFVVGVRLDSEKLRVMERFGGDEYFSLELLHNAHEAMNSMLLYVNFPQHESKSWFEKVFGYTALQAATFIAGLYALLKVLLYIVTSFRLAWKRLIPLLFIVSFGWKGYEMYLRERVKAEVALSTNYGQACMKPQSLWQQVTKGLFFAKDDCHEFHYHTMIDPLWKVAPSKVAGELLTEVVWTPLQTAGEPIAKLVQDVFGTLPVGLWPVAFVFTALMLLLIYTLFNGSSLRLGYGLIQIGGRSSTTQALAEREELENLRIEVGNLREENALLQSQKEAIEMGAAGDARPANRRAGVNHRMAVKVARPKKGREPIGNGSTADSSHEYSDEPWDADNIGPRSSTGEEVRRRSTEARGGQRDTQHSPNHSGSRDTIRGCQIRYTESANLQDDDDEPEHQSFAGSGNRSRTSETESTRPVTVAGTFAL